MTKRAESASRRARNRALLAEPRRIALIAYPGMEALDLTGPLAVFGGANRLCRAEGRAPPYRTEVLARRAGPVATSDGLRLVADRRYGSIRVAFMRTLGIPPAAYRLRFHDAAA